MRSLPYKLTRTDEKKFAHKKSRVLNPFFDELPDSGNTVDLSYVGGPIRSPMFPRFGTIYNKIDNIHLYGRVYFVLFAGLRIKGHHGNFRQLSACARARAFGIILASFWDNFTIILGQC